MRTIPFFTPQKIYTKQKKEIHDAIRNVFRKGIFILGDEVAQFEASFAAYLGVPYAIGVASGTDAITLALKALDIEAQDEVIIPANSYPTAFAVYHQARIRLVDIDPVTYTIDVKKIEQAITKKTRAIIPVHLYGHAADMMGIKKIAKKYNLFVIEDAAQAHGAIYKGKKVGIIGDIGCFSFYPTKNLGAFGDGGMIVTKKRFLADKIRAIRMYGEKKRYKSIYPGFNSRLDEVQAAILRIRLNKLEEENERRRMIASLYQKSLANLPISLPTEQRDAKHVYHLFVIATKKRTLLQQFLGKNGVQTAIHFPTPIHIVPSFKQLKYGKNAFPITVQLAKQILSLPCHPYLKKNDVYYISNLCKTFFA